MLSDDDLRSLLLLGEGDRLELKARLDDSGRETVCALANDLDGSGKPGFLFIGVDDKTKKATGLTIDDPFLTMLAQIRTGGNLQPLPSLSLRKLTIEGGECAVIIVEPTDDPPMRYRGRIWIRVGPTTLVASAQDEQRLVERRRQKNPSYDHVPAPEARIDDLDLDFFERVYLPAAYAPEVLERNGRSQEKRLEALRLIVSEGQPSIGGVLILSPNARRFIPGAYVQFVRFAGEDLLSPVLDQKEFDGKLSDVARSVLETLCLNVAVSLKLRPGEPDLRTPAYHMLALQEIALNAIMHRLYDYSTNSPIRIYFFSDRVEIMSPGGPFGRVTAKNFGHMADYRNPLIAEALKTLGFAQRFGLGLEAARTSLLENENPAMEWDVQPTAVNITVHSRVLAS